jgi:hypothetical protein
MSDLNLGRVEAVRARLCASIASLAAIHSHLLALNAIVQTDQALHQQASLAHDSLELVVQNYLSFDSTLSDPDPAIVLLDVDSKLSELPDLNLDRDVVLVVDALDILTCCLSTIRTALTSCFLELVDLGHEQQQPGVANRLSNAAGDVGHVNSMMHTLITAIKDANLRIAIRGDI